MSENLSNISDEISLKDLLIKAQVWLKFLLNQWMIIGLFAFIGGIGGFFYANNQQPTYTAKVTFVMEEGKGTTNGLGGLASLAGQFGVDVGANSGGGLLTGDNILYYFRSLSLSREVLLSRYNGVSTESVADLYAKTYGLKDEWSSNKNIGEISFHILELNKPYSRLQDSLLQEIVNTINSGQFSVARIDKKAGFIDVSCTMHNELLAKVYCERIVQRAVERYIAIKTRRQNATVEKLQLRVDSISSLLRQKTVSGASLQNSSSTMDINPLFRTNTSVAVETTIRDKALLSTIFSSVTQNLEMAKFTLSQETPVIQVVDSPILPLYKEKISRMKSSLIGSFLFSFIFCFFLITRRLYSELMK
jgi:hypothetical protein